jgi:hypothetical protein
MRRLTLIFIFILFNIINFAQEELAPPVEIWFVTEGLPSSPIMTFTMTVQAQCWGVIYPTPIPLLKEYFF